MEVFQSRDKVLVKNDNQTYEFKKQDTLVVAPCEDCVPSESAIKALESEGFTVKSQGVTYELSFRSGYGRGEAAHELGFDPNDSRFEDFLGAIKYGVRLEFDIESDGTTWITGIRGNELENPIKF